MTPYAAMYGQQQADGRHRVHVRCADCGQRIVEVEFGMPACPDRDSHGREVWGPCGNDPLTRERRDGPRYMEAIRGARAMRRWSFDEVSGRLTRSTDRLATPDERAVGIPVGWFGQ